jgi:predicted metalloprotease with PDZ domain
MRVTLWFAVLSLLCSSVEASNATYHVRFREGSPPQLTVTAMVPIAGAKLTMATTRPAGIEELDRSGWPGLIRDLRVTDGATGEVLVATGAADRGWSLDRSLRGYVRLEYAVDLSPFAKRHWPAPREAFFLDGTNFSLIGRALFVTTPAASSSEVSFDLPSGWHATTPWRRRTSTTFAAESVEQLTDNLLAFTRRPSETIRSGRFTLHVVPMAAWGAVRGEIHSVLRSTVKRFATAMQDPRETIFVVVLLPHGEQGGESYVSSLAMSPNDVPTAGNRGTWANLIAHEIFHSWNGWRLRGDDRQASQWFQEGFTEYMANLAMTNAGAFTEEQLRSKFATHVLRYRELTTTLAAPGTRKGAPLYSGGALVAFAWDGMIRESTRNRRSLADVFRRLLVSTGHGERPWTWSDLRAALQATAALDWQAFYDRHIANSEPLPLDAMFARVGWRMTTGMDGSLRIEKDPGATRESRTRARRLIE